MGAKTLVGLLCIAFSLPAVVFWYTCASDAKLVILMFGRFVSELFVPIQKTLHSLTNSSPYLVHSCGLALFSRRRSSGISPPRYRFAVFVLFPLLASRPHSYSVSSSPSSFSVLQNDNWFAVFWAVGFQELFRYLYWRLLKRAEKGLSVLGDMSRDRVALCCGLGLVLLTCPHS